MIDQKKVEKRFNLLIVLVLVVIIASLMAIITLVIYIFPVDYPYLKLRGSLGEFGDYIGGVLNPSYSFLALIALLVTLFLQNKSLIETRDFSKKQIFENSFYNLIKLYSDIVDSFSEKENIADAAGARRDFVYVGRECMKYYYEKKIKRSWDSVGFNEPKELEAKERYKVFSNNYNYKIGHYFRVLYRIFKFIHESDIKEKKFYAGIIRAQISAYELLILFYNCLSADGAKFKKYAKEYSLYENMPDDLIYEVRDDLMLYGDEYEYEDYFGDNPYIKNYRFNFSDTENEDG